jgi:hypothetical protein
MKKIGFLAAAFMLVNAAILSAPASAASFIYTISGNGSGSLNGVAFDDADYTFTLTADGSSLYQDVALQIHTSLTSAAFTIDNAGSGILLGQTQFGEYYNQAFFGMGPYGVDLLDFYLPHATDITQAAGPLTGTGIYALDYFNNIATSAGLLSLNESSDVTFSSSAAVPELATWGMMVGGFGVIGAAMRRRKVKVSFA